MKHLCVELGFPLVYFRWSETTYPTNLEIVSNNIRVVPLWLYEHHARCRVVVCLDQVHSYQGTDSDGTADQADSVPQSQTFQTQKEQWAEENSFVECCNLKCKRDVCYHWTKMELINVGTTLTDVRTSFSERPNSK